MGFLFVYMMSRTGAKGLFDMSQVFNRPSRAIGWFLLGNSILAIWRVNYMGQVNQNSASRFNLHQRVSQNEQTHSILKTMSFHLKTRQMGVFDVNAK